MGEKRWARPVIGSLGRRPSTHSLCTQRGYPPPASMGTERARISGPSGRKWSGGLLIGDVVCRGSSGDGTGRRTWWRWRGGPGGGRVPPRADGWSGSKRLRLDTVRVPSGARSMEGEQATLDPAEPTEKVGPAGTGGVASPHLGSLEQKPHLHGAAGPHLWKRKFLVQEPGELGTGWLLEAVTPPLGVHTSTPSWGWVTSHRPRVGDPGGHKKSPGILE